MMRFAWAGFVIDSDVPLPELPRAARSGRVVRLRRTRIDLRRRATWVHHWRFENGRRWLSIARDSDGYLLRFRDYAAFRVSPALDGVEYDPIRSTTFDTVRHLLLDQVLPAIAAAGGQTAVHACGIEIDGRGVGLIGRAGQGKSTLGAFCAAAGDRVITDDCLLLATRRRRIVALPSYPSIRLSPAVSRRLFGAAARVRVAEYGAKVRVSRDLTPAVRFSRGAVPMTRLYLLERTGSRSAPRVEPLAPRERYLAMFTHTFRLDPYDRPTLRGEIERLAAVAARVDVRRLIVPRSLAALSRVRDTIVADLETG